MSPSAIDRPLHKQARDGIDRNQTSIQHGETDAFAEAAGLGNDSDDNYLGRGMTGQPQLRQRLLNPGSCDVRRS